MALLPPVGEDDADCGADTELAEPAEPAAAAQRQARPRVPHEDLTAHARELWGRGLIFASAAAFARALERERPELWHGRAATARKWYSARPGGTLIDEKSRKR